MVRCRVAGESRQLIKRFLFYQGGVGHIMMSSYSGALFVVGGSGVSFALSAVQDMVRAGGDSHIRIIDIVWCIQDPGTLYCFIVFP
jgi:hypothetical protein